MIRTPVVYAKRYLTLANYAPVSAIRCLLTSDIHTSGLDTIKVPADIDIVVIAGDVMASGMDSDEAGERWLRNVFFKWAEDLGDRGVSVVLIPGNHDRYLWRRWNAGRTETWPQNVHYLIDSAAEVDGIRFWGTPWCTNNQRAKRFECTEREACEKFGKIPAGVDVLISHSPPAIPGSDVDTAADDGYHAGSVSLSEAILRVSPRICVCGHVHKGSREPVKLGSTIVVNVARVAEDRSVAECPPVVLEVVGDDYGLK